MLSQSACSIFSKIQISHSLIAKEVRNLIPDIPSKLREGLEKVKEVTETLLPEVEVQKGNITLEKFNDIFSQESFVGRHIGPDDAEIATMLEVIGQPSLDAMADAIVEEDIRLGRALDITSMSEAAALAELKSIASLNQISYKSYLGMGYYGTVTPTPILRHVVENAGWYTPYTPYQAEIAQGRLESLLNYQTMVGDLTGLSEANASLLDEATAAAEAMTMAYNRLKGKRSVFFVSEDVFPQTIDVVKTRAQPFGIEVVVGDHKTFEPSDKVFGVLVQYPGKSGSVDNFDGFVAASKAAGAIAICATDLLALTMLKPPGEIGFDIALGNSQRFGVPQGYGGPHAAFFAASADFRRIMPGRIIGVSKDVQNGRALRMALQTREQHIRREKATSNICTAQALLANVAAMYGVYHGPHGLKKIAEKVHGKALILAAALRNLELPIKGDPFFDTVTVVSGLGTVKLVEHMKENLINVRKNSETEVSVTIDETVNESDLFKLINAFATFQKLPMPSFNELTVNFDLLSAQRRTSEYMTHPVFNTHHSESEIMRYIYSLMRKDIGLHVSMVPLGSCTMKLNAASELAPISWPEFNSLHPFVPESQALGYTKLFADLEKMLCDVTGFYAMSLQPNAGSQGEYAGLLAIKNYLSSIGQGHRDICVIPESAHGTNPASAAMCGMKIIVVKCTASGNIDWNHLVEVVEKNSQNLACMMMTFPATYGFFDKGAKKICELIHQHGGQMYMDGANMNAQVGLTSPATVGADVCHLNLHKTFCIPHGGGGPGMGPIGVAKHLAPFLPSHSVTRKSETPQTGAVSAASHGSASILPIVWMYLKMMGGEGLRKATQVALLSANYMAAKLEQGYTILYRGASGYCAHEFIIDLRPFKDFGIQAEDVAKRLMDYGFHAPTLSFPVPGTLMIEPTESEPLSEMSRYIDALLDIRKDIAAIESGAVKFEDSVLANAPHPSSAVLGENWDYKYSRERAAFPLPFVKKNKFWPQTARIDNVYGDRNLFCSCPPVEEM